MSSTEEKPHRYRADQKRENDRKRIIDLLRKRMPNVDGLGCLLCRMIVEDYDEHGTLTDWPLDVNDKGLFPASGKRLHIELELRSLHLP